MLLRLHQKVSSSSILSRRSNHGGCSNGSAVWRLNLEHAEQVGTTGRSGRRKGVKGRKLYLVERRNLTSAVAAPEQALPSTIISAEWDAPISLWWDQPPYVEPQ